MKNSMKWILALVAVCLVAVGLVLILKPSAEPVPAVPTFKDYLMEDYEYVQSLGDDSTHVALYEVETVLNGNIAETAPEDLAIVSSMTVYAVDDTVFLKTRTWETGEVVVEKKAGTWLGDFNIEHPDLVMDFDAAVEKLYQAAADSLVTLPAGDKMTFRRPANADSFTPLYIFGTTGTNFVAVDGVTGEVKPVE